MGFVLKSINASDRLGPDLLELRRRAGLTREQAAETSKLTPGFISLLEDDRFEELDDPSYAERQLRAYIMLLGGNPSYFMHKYRARVGAERFRLGVKDLLPRPRQIRAHDLIVGPRWIVLATFLTFLLLLGGYVLFQVRGISSTPPLTLIEPLDGTQVAEPMVRVRGKTLPEATVAINGQQVAVNETGEFSMILSIPRGTTLVVVSAKRRHGKKIEQSRRVMYARPLP